MKLVVFTKLFKEKSLAELAGFAHDAKLDGFDLCVRRGYDVNPANVLTELPAAANFFAREGLSIAMVTGDFDVLLPDHATAEPHLAAMDKAGVRFLKLGYFHFDPRKQDYWPEVDRIRRAFEGWQELSRRHHVKVCYHTHSHGCMGLNCASLAHLVRGFDPQCIGAYIDPLHMLLEGEEFPVGAAMVKEHLSLVALKDVLITRQERNGHGAPAHKVVRAGEGMVDWTVVFDELFRIGFGGPLSIHCEFEVPKEEFAAAARHDAAFFRGQIEKRRLRP